MDGFFELLQPQIPVIILGTITISLVLLITSLGGLFSEKSGVINIGLEGMMIFGAFFGTFVMLLLLKEKLPWYFVILIGMLSSMSASAVLGFLHALLSITFKINQVISGTAINLISPAIVVFIMKTIYKTDETLPLDFRLPKYKLFGLPPISNEQVFLLSTILILFIITIFIYYKTRFGRHLKAVGQNPQAAASTGINVNKIRYISVIISSSLAGLGGLSLVVLVSGRMSVQQIAGYGFLSLAILIFGGWHPIKCFLGSILFAFFLALVPAFNGIIFGLSSGSTGENAVNIQGIIRLGLETGPYIMAIIILAMFSKRNKAPKALGISYDKEKR